jgi:hypothetical protein
MAGEFAHCFDAEFPPASPPPLCAAVLGYIGGTRAARVWTLPEWLRFSGLRQFPAYVPQVGPDPLGQAAEAVALMRARGWRTGRALVFDLETGQDHAWWHTLATRVRELGQLPVAYGSLSTVLGNKAAVNWTAAWDGIPQLDAGQTIEATQYAANLPWQGTEVDLSVVSAELLARGGVAART